MVNGTFKMEDAAFNIDNSNVHLKWFMIFIMVDRAFKLVNGPLKMYTGIQKGE